MSRADTATRWMFRFVWTALITGVAVLVPSGLESRRSTLNRANLKQIMLAMHHYHDQYQCFPPAYFLDSAGRPAHSWRVMLLPFLGRNDLYSRYRFDEPWDGPNNKALLSELPDVYQWPWSGETKGRTRYKALLGSQTAFPGPVSTCMDDIRDGTSNSLMIIETPTEVPWTSPTDLPFAQLKTEYRSYTRPGTFEKNGFAAGVADGSVKEISSLLDPKILHAYGTINSGRRHPGLNGRTLPFEASGSPEHEEWDDRPLQATDVWPTMRWPLAPERNFVYCATTQIALQNRAREMKREPESIVGVTPLARALAGDVFLEKNLDPACYIAETGRTSPALDTKIRAQLREKFPGVGFPYTGPLGKTSSFSCLHKSLPFATAFEKATKPLLFRHGGKTTSVKAFGCSDPLNLPAREQVKVVSFQRDGEFVVVLTTDSPRRDAITLARVEPRATLAETWENVQKLLSNPLKGDLAALRDVDTLMVPRMNLSTRRRYVELMSKGADLDDAVQYIRFHLDERGAFLESGSEMLDSAGEDFRPREFLLGRPFLLALTEQGATQPYFVIWVANPELMEPFGAP